MGFPNVGLIGKAGSGKDTVATHLMRRPCFYTRVAFADPLKDMALKLDPIVYDEYDCATDLRHVRVSELVGESGWDGAKREPEVRRILQHIGQTVRDLDEDFWVNVALKKIEAARTWNLPVVVTDVRYANEVTALRSCGFTLMRVVRPGAGLSGSAGEHASETELDDVATEFTINNTGTLSDLHRAVDALIIPR